MVWAYQNPDKVKTIVNRAYKWAKELTWENESKKWIDLFDQACKTNDSLRRGKPTKAIGEDDGGSKYSLPANKKISRNSLCPLCLDEGIRIKIKKCIKHRGLFI